jgi:hypothetical protein
LSSPPQSRGAYFTTDSGKVWISVNLMQESPNV